jgi:DNA-binding PadR family transcriptional regulator
MSLRFGLLGLLAADSLHGYEIKQRFEEMLGGTWDLNIGSVYQVLQRLERDGLVEPVGDRGDRGKQLYRATRAGDAALAEWVEGVDDGPLLLRDEIYIKVALGARKNQNGAMKRLLTRQRHAYLQRLRDLADSEKAARARGRIELALLFKGGRLHTEADLKWLEACMEELGSK